MIPRSRGPAACPIRCAPGAVPKCPAVRWGSVTGPREAVGGVGEAFGPAGAGEVFEEGDGNPAGGGQGLAGLAGGERLREGGEQVGGGGVGAGEEHDAVGEAEQAAGAGGGGQFAGAEAESGEA